MPRSFYYSADLRNPDREPTRDELLALRDRTERQIHKAVGHVIPETDSWKVDIDIIPDDVSRSQAPVVTSNDDPRRQVVEWGIVSAACAAVSILAAVGLWNHVVRRPTWPPEQTFKSHRYHVDSASDRGPSERVRELIRCNPQAAASVLQRWTAGDQAL